MLIRQFCSTHRPRFCLHLLILFFSTFISFQISYLVSTYFTTISLTNYSKTHLISPDTLHVLEDLTSSVPILMTVSIITRVSNVQSLYQSVKPFSPISLSCISSEILKENRRPPSICFSSFARGFPKNQEPTMA